MTNKTGKYVRSQLLRVDADFADWVRAIAKSEGITITEVTRVLHASMEGGAP